MFLIDRKQFLQSGISSFGVIVKSQVGPNLVNIVAYRAKSIICSSVFPAVLTKYLMSFFQHIQIIDISYDALTESSLHCVQTRGSFRKQLSDKKIVMPNEGGDFEGFFYVSPRHRYFWAAASVYCTATFKVSKPVLYYMSR